ncbi:EscU/YscU/HrcU family type III secretion system export apparatus switch protein [Bacillus sp. DTU_2020_1000418_1_SI_GHA_SEK_038]|uniref:EscU/YscU/HrcU family type III secretion system export apparatus switch protein n=1 Tax=Bacillus sp. DTU_2020_1000418_1_SI_GHA_SEK_038 TaxID=3077585 RepID=UPI0028E842DE|nr:EscU/YscU/HrcU family type III secretion system export apparatus switch protein [Bacillus sp. DTU_2020_1000418_1_SI_GHA_SEK_038]WNS77158.1 EscU/YscU/HrcU family type III secretion system export apparatus switch protein [Bacillus sp. DTU_2020_1000418_1_SI_GHA_SEK_038]
MTKQNELHRKEAVALTYDKNGSDTPYVSAKGKGLIAEGILAKAREHDIPVQEDPSLLELLGKLNINEQIPEELYEAVAEVFAFIYKADKKAGKINSK